MRILIVNIKIVNIKNNFVNVEIQLLNHLKKKKKFEALVVVSVFRYDFNSKHCF